ncbi:hypothetical protein DYY66_0371 [Candidatus Nitrosotalea sp. FS]|nr:hypothetical protein [Candidatus Nitrosotalea sp. FS]
MMKTKTPSIQSIEEDWAKQALQMAIQARVFFLYHHTM